MEIVLLILCWIEENLPSWNTLMKDILWSGNVFIASQWPDKYGVGLHAFLDFEISSQDRFCCSIQSSILFTCTCKSWLSSHLEIVSMYSILQKTLYLCILCERKRWYILSMYSMRKKTLINFIYVFYITYNIEKLYLCILYYIQHWEIVSVLYITENIDRVDTVSCPAKHYTEANRRHTTSGMIWKIDYGKNVSELIFMIMETGCKIGIQNHQQSQ